MKFVRDLFTGVDGTSFDLGRVLLAAGCVIMLAGGVGSIVKGALDFVAFGAGFGGLLTGGGALLMLKRNTEPQVVTATQTTPTGVTSQTVEAGAAKTEGA
jgi:hypothetical protein